MAALALFVMLAPGCHLFDSSGDPVAQWPAARATAGDSALAAQGRADYQRAGYDARRYFVSPYTATGNYLQYGVTVQFRPGPRIRLDSLGLPMVLNGEAFYYNPVTIAQYGLSAHGRWLAGSGTVDSVAFLRAAEKLLTMVGPDGALRYPFAFPYYLIDSVLPAGWVSGMAQGQALSLFARAYAATRAEHYLSAGRQALAFLTVPISRGGPAASMGALDPSLIHYRIYEEYPVYPPSYTLNGFLFTLLGLYDWSVVDPAQTRRDLARALFEHAMKTVEGILPLYDIGGFTAYDLGFLTYGRPPHVVPTYHAVHIYLLHALKSVAPSTVLEEYECRWLEDAQPGTCSSGL